MSLFKRKGRRISTFEDEAPGDAPLGEQNSTSEAPIQVAVKFGKRPTKQFVLRRSTAVGDGSGRNDDGNEDDDDGPAVVRPSISRSSSTKSKKRMSSSSRLSFGVGAASEADEATAEDGASVATTPRRTGIASLSQRVLETNAFKKSLTGRLPTRPLDREDEDRPRYSKEYLEELQSSTPNTPRNVSSKKSEGDVGGGDSDYGDAMQLDASELEGATVVEPSDLGTLRTGMVASSAPAAHVLTQTEIDERKDRRARLALEQNAIALGSDDDEENGYISLVSGDSKKKKKAESRLVREDEDLGEGFDEFVEDGGLSLGRKAEREARRRRKQEMASLISAAEGKGSGGGGGGNGYNRNGNNDDNDEDMDSDDSEAERQAAYNEAQTRAGMDGLKRQGGGGGSADNNDEDEMNVLGGGGNSSSRSRAGAAIPKMLPLPDLAECLARMQRAVQNLEDEVALRRQKLAEVEAEKAEIAVREAELQEILNKTGEKYQAILGVKVAAADNAANPASPAAAAAAAASLLAATQSPLRSLAGVVAGPTERGLESLGGTPVRRTDSDDVF